MAGLTENIKTLLQDFKDRAGGIDATFMVDLEDASVQVSYPEKESKSLEFIATITATSIVSYEAGIKSMGDEKFTIEQMEVLSQDKRVFTLKISEQYALCIIGSRDDLKIGFVRTMFERTYKDRIVNAMKEAGMMD